MRLLCTILVVTSLLARPGLAEAVCDMPPTLDALLFELAGQDGVIDTDITTERAQRLDQTLAAINRIALDEWQAEQGLTRIRGEVALVLFTTSEIVRLRHVIDPDGMTEAIGHIYRQIGRHCAPDAWQGPDWARGSQYGLPGQGEGENGIPMAGETGDPPMVDRVMHFSALLAGLGLLLLAFDLYKRARARYFDRRYGRRHCMIAAELHLGGTRFFGTVDILGSRGARFVLSEGTDLDVFEDHLRSKAVTVLFDDIAIPARTFNLEDRQIRMHFEADLPRPFQIEILDKSAITPFRSEEPRPPDNFAGIPHPEAWTRAYRAQTRTELVPEVAAE